MAKPVYWQPEEVALLDKYAERLPFPLLVEKLHALERKLGIPLRTEGAIDAKIYKMGWRRGVNDECMPVFTIAKTLGVPHHRVKRWLKFVKHLKVRDRFYIKLEDLKVFAKEHPERFAEISEDRLKWLLQDDELVQTCLKQKSLRPSPTPVKCIETGVIFKSKHAAEKVLGLQRSSIQKSFRNGHRAGGYHWEYANQSEGKTA